MELEKALFDNNGKVLLSGVKLVAAEALLLYRGSDPGRKAELLQSLRECGKFGEALADFVAGYDGEVMA